MNTFYRILPRIVGMGLVLIGSFIMIGVLEAEVEIPYIWSVFGIIGIGVGLIGIVSPFKHN